MRLILSFVTENVEPVRRHYDAFNRGDLEGLLEPFDEDIVFVEEPDLRPDAGTHSGIAAMRTFFEEMFEGAAEVNVEPREWIEQRDKVIVPLRFFGRFKHTGIEGETEMVHVWTVRRGKLAHLHVYTSKERALEAEGIAG
jgi:ketosteroid isomerase-like protein